MSGSILIIDDDRDVLDALRVLLEDEFEEIVVESNANRITGMIPKAYDVILLDMNFSAGINSGNEGLFWLSRIKEKNANAFIVMMTAYGNIDLAVEALKRGANDFVLKPWDNDKMIATLRAGLALRKVNTAAVTRSNFTNASFIKGSSQVMQELHEQINRVAPTDASVLILGENGTGKEIIAREIHRLSKRKDHGFFSVDMSALPSTLFESELFGHKKGAFTDARSDRTGRFVEANGGTLFLDEIGNLPIAQQAKLLTTLQQREVTPVGANEKIPFDIRLLTATNAALPERVEEGSFRQDLYYRINTITLHVPPLRERDEDIVLLANHFLRQYVSTYEKSEMHFHDDVKRALREYGWPGNVRELQHTVEKAVILSHTEVITAEQLNLSISSKTTSLLGNRRLDDIEKEALIQSLSAHGGNIVHAAKALGITRQTFYNKMKKYGI
jgi:two-component system, NtrC family, response regulator HydG